MKKQKDFVLKRYIHGNEIPKQKFQRTQIGI